MKFTFTHSPISLTGEGEEVLVGGKIWKIKKYGVVEDVVALGRSGSSDPIVSGKMVHYLSVTLDAVSGEGPVHGTFTLTPLAHVGGGVWEGTYAGYRSKTSTRNVFSLPLKVVERGKGGSFNGMTLLEETLITAYNTPPIYWTGVGEGIYRSR